MKDRHGIKEFKGLLGVFGLSPDTVDKVVRLLHASGEYNQVPQTWRSLDTQTKMFINRILGDDTGSEETPTDGGDAPEVSDNGRGMEAQGQEDEAPATQTARFEGFKGGFQDFLKEVTISVDSDDPDAKMRFQQQLRRATTSSAGERTVARDNVARAQQARQAVDPADPDKSLKDRELKRREMTAREERKRIMQQPTREQM